MSGAQLNMRRGPGQSVMLRVRDFPRRFARKASGDLSPVGLFGGDFVLSRRLLATSGIGSDFLNRQMSRPADSRLC
jgi:hypothetical protein